MKTIITIIVTAIVVGGGTFFSLKSIGSKQQTQCDLQTLLTAKQTVQKRLEDFSTRTQAQLQSLARVVEADKEFSLRILVENDRSAPAVTEMAGQFIDPMGLSVLEITDSSRTILSSGHFPASAGNKSMHKAGVLSTKLTATMENLRGTPTLTLLAEYPFAIAGFRFFLSGGIVVDTKLLELLTPIERILLLLKNGDTYLGMENITSVSAISDNQIIINDEKYPAAEIELPVAGMDRKISLIVVLKQ
jgi:hypothetical protein